MSLPDSLVFGQYEGSPITPAPSSEASTEISLRMGDRYLNLDMLAGMPLIFSGKVFYDENHSAIQDDEEFGAEGRSRRCAPGRNCRCRHRRTPSAPCRCPSRWPGA